MVRCYICDARCARDDEVFVCEHCGNSSHRHCVAEFETDTCPRRVGEPMIGALEF